MHLSHQPNRHVGRRLAVVVAVATAVLAGPVVQAEASPTQNGSIAFGRFDPELGDSSIWIANAEGREQRRLTTVPSFFSDWRPDGRGLVFDFVAKDGVHISRIESDGTGERQLTFGAGIQEVPRYSPDGREIIFDASSQQPDDPGFHTDIWLMAADGSHARPVTSGGFDVEPVFSPNGRYIAFGRIVGATDPNNFSQHEAIYVGRTDGTGLHQVVEPRAGLEHPRWSPDGQFLTFNIAPDAIGAPGVGTIYAVRHDDHRLHIIRAADREWSFTKAVWSPKGDAILVVCHRNATNTNNICRMNPATGEIDQVVAGSPSRPVNFPSWGPRPTKTCH